MGTKTSPSFIKIGWKTKKFIFYLWYLLLISLPTVLPSYPGTAESTESAERKRKVWIFLSVYTESANIFKLFQCLQNSQYVTESTVGTQVSLQNQQLLCNQFFHGSTDTTHRNLNISTFCVFRHTNSSPSPPWMVIFSQLGNSGKSRLGYLGQFIPRSLRPLGLGLQFHWLD